MDRQANGLTVIGIQIEPEGCFATIFCVNFTLATIRAKRKRHDLILRMFLDSGFFLLLWVQIGGNDSWITQVPPSNQIDVIGLNFALFQQTLIQSF